MWIESAIDETASIFHEHHEWFFTEYEVSSLLISNLRRTFSSRIDHRPGFEHKLIRAEWPTPFRCCMVSRDFVLKGPDDRYEKNGKHHLFQRGSIDCTVLNEAFVQECVARREWHLISGKPWSDYNKYIGNRVPLEMAIEIHLITKQLNDLSAAHLSIVQDAKKVRACVEHSNCYGKSSSAAMSLVFINGQSSSSKIKELRDLVDRDLIPCSEHIIRWIHPGESK